MTTVLQILISKKMNLFSKYTFNNLEKLERRRGVAALHFFRSSNLMEGALTDACFFVEKRYAINK